jgi:hypothetical protein
MEKPFAAKMPKAFWRGAANNAVRKKLLEVTRAQQDSWAYVKSISWRNRTNLLGGSASEALPIAEHCKYMYLLHVEGVCRCSKARLC